MRVALIRGSSNGKSAYREIFGVSMPPLGLASLAAAVMPNGHKTVLVDALAEGFDVDQTAEIIKSWAAQIVAVTINASPYYEFAANLAKKVKAENKNIVFVAGGHHATFVYSQVLASDFDYVVLGEGEQTFSELVNTLAQNKSVSQVKGLAFKGDGKIVQTTPRPLMENLDSLPVPAFDMFNKDRCKADVFGSGSHLITVETSRGCPYNCEFCSVTVMWGHCWRFKSVKRVLQELRLIKALGYNWVFIVDDNFMVPVNLKERELLFNELKNQGDAFNFISQIRIDIAAHHPDIIKSAANSGLRIVFLGMESGNDDVLKSMRKGTNVATAMEGIKVLHENGILTHGGFIVGAPYENENQLNSTFEYADRLRMAGLDSIQFSIYTPLPGTKAFSKAVKDNSLVTLDWSMYDGLHPVMKSQRKPHWLYFKSNTAAAMFFLKKWISNKSTQPLGSDYANLVRNATRFISKNFMEYVKDLLVTLPLNSLRIWLIFRKAEAAVTKDALEILGQKNSL
ncbi:MAG TPA: radical SAM protein [Candidatus Limnocylindrales bacterium]|nr:radical SAM protein [Candidatus Limnocylindrales bacterium]